MSRPYGLIAHRPAGRVTHAARIAEDGREAITACGRSLGADWSEVDGVDAVVTCRGCRRTEHAL